MKPGDCDRCCENYTWNPKSNITAYELAQLIPFFHIHEKHYDEFYDKLPDSCKKHLIRRIK